MHGYVCVCALVNVKSGKGREKMREFWDEVNDCLGMFEEGRRVFGDMNALAAFTSSALQLVQLKM